MKCITGLFLLSCQLLSAIKHVAVNYYCQICVPAGQRSGPADELRYDTMRVDIVYLRALISSPKGQLNLAHGTKNEKKK